MTAISCAQLRLWLSSAQDPPELPDVDTAAHVVSCAHCRGALAGIVAHLFAPPPGDVSCDDCADDLPAFVELEQAQGAVVAARSFPQIWWHLWTCPDCLEATERLSLLLAAEKTGLLAPPPRLMPALPLLPPIRLERSFLHAVFAPQFSLGARWHEGDDPLVLAERSLPQHHLLLNVRQQGQDQWELELVVEPPVSGQIVLRFGDLQYRAMLNDGRTAVISALPLSLLADRHGPDMLICFEREHDDAISH